MILSLIPTGIRTFDANINGGFPSGSVILLLEDVGAGAREFIYTSVYNIIKMKSNPNSPNQMKETHKSTQPDEVGTAFTLPNEMCYISVSKSKEDILNENAYAFHKDFYNAIKNGLTFKELSDVYFRQSAVQNFWVSDQKAIMDFDCIYERGILDEISTFLEEHAKNNIVIIDSLTELMMCEADYLNMNDIVMFLRGMVKVSKTWNGLIYLILSAKILEEQVQETIADVVDGVLEFEWFDKGSVKMRRNLYISKFRGLMPRLEQNKIAKFETKITSDGGFEVSNVRKIV